MRHFVKAFPSKEDLLDEFMEVLREHFSVDFRKVEGVVGTQVTFSFKGPQALAHDPSGQVAYIAFLMNDQEIRSLSFSAGMGYIGRIIEESGRKMAGHFEEALKVKNKV